MALGVDVHGDKGPVDWKRVKGAGYSFAWVKATEGKTFNDARFAENRAGATAAGLHVFGYHFARPDLNSALDEAKHFISIVGKVKPGELRPVLDFEHFPAVSSWALAWLALVEKELGVTPVLYTYPSFLSSMSNHAALAKYPLWYASYGPNDGKRHTLVKPEGFAVVAHQFTSNGVVPGILGRVDLNYAEHLTPILAQREVRVWRLVKDGTILVERQRLAGLAAYIARHPRKVRGHRIVRVSKLV